MAKRKNTVAKVFAFIALFWIVLGVVWTWIMFIYGNSKSPKKNIKEVDSKQLGEIMQNMKVEINTWSTK